MTTSRGRAGTWGLAVVVTLPRRPRTRRGARAAARPVHVAGRHRCVPCARPHWGRDGLAEDRRPLRRARRDDAVPRRRAESGRRRVDGVRAGRRSRARRCVARGAGAPVVPPPAECARRPSPEARTHGRGPHRARACRITRAQCARTGAAPGPRPKFWLRQRRWQGRIMSAVHVERIDPGRGGPLAPRPRPSCSEARAVLRPGGGADCTASLPTPRVASLPWRLGSRT